MTPPNGPERKMKDETKGSQVTDRKPSERIAQAGMVNNSEAGQLSEIAAILDELWAAVFPPTSPASMEQKAREWAEKMIQAPGFLSVGPNHPMRHSELSNSVFLAKQTPESMGFAQASCSRWLTAFATSAVQEAVRERDSRIASLESTSLAAVCAEQRDVLKQRDARIAELERERNRYATDLAYANASIQQLEGGAAYKSMKSQCEMATSRAIFAESSRDDLAGKVEAMERVIAEAKSALSALNSKPAGSGK